MNRELFILIASVVLGSVGTYLLLPHKHGASKPRGLHILGGAIGALAALLFATRWSAPGPWASTVFFYGFGLASILCGVLTVTARSPIHNALWFAAVILSTSGLFLLAGAQFLAAGTVIVYAGAIIVTFLFVLMLAQMEGTSSYDRAARAPLAATLTCYALLLAVISCLVETPAASAGPGLATAGLPRTDDLASRAAPAESPTVARIVERAVRPTERITSLDGEPKPHVAGLGESLYSDHLVTVELVGTLLFIALIGALSIASPKRPVRPGDRAPAASTPAT